MTDTAKPTRSRQPRKRGPRRPAPRTGSDAFGDIYTPAAEPLPTGIGQIIPLRPGARNGHPHQGMAGRDAADLKRYDRQNLARELDQRRKRNHAAALTRSLELLPAEMRRGEDEIYDEYLASAPADVIERGETGIRRWAAQRAHEDMAAAILSVGGTVIEAALHAGVAPSTVSRMTRDPEFAQRVAGQRRRLLGRVQGGALAELERRIFSGEALLMETKDLLAVIARTGELGGDQVVAPPRVAGGSGGGHNGPSVTIYNQNQLASIAAGQPPPQPPAQVVIEHAQQPRQLAVGAIPGSGAVGADPTGDGGTESTDFPVFGLGGAALAEDVPPV